MLPHWLQMIVQVNPAALQVNDPVTGVCVKAPLSFVLSLSARDGMSNVGLSLLVVDD